MPDLSSGARGQHQRHDAHDEGHGGHEDGAEPQVRGLEHGRFRIPSVLLLQMLGELHDQDRVLAGEADEHQEADLREDVVIPVVQLESRDRGQHAHRHDQDDREWEREALVLRREHQEHEQYAERKHQESRIARDELLVGEIRPLVRHAAGQRLIEDLRHRGLSLAGAEPRSGSAVDVRRGVGVVALHHIRSEGARDVDHGAEGHHLAVRVAGLERHDVIELGAERRIRLRDYLEGAAETVEVVDVERAQVHLQGLEHVRKLHVLALGLDAIDIDVELRNVDLVGAKGAAEGRVLVGLAEGFRQGGEQGLRSRVHPVLDLKLEAAKSPEPDHRRGCHDDHEGVLDGRHLLIQRRGDGRTGQRLRGALREIIEREEDERGARALSEAVDGHSRELHRVGDAGLLECDLGDAPRDRFRSIERCGGGQLRDRDEVLLVHRRNEAPRHGVEAEPGEDDQPAVDGERDAAVAHGDGGRSRVAVARPGEACVEALEETAEEAVHAAHQEVGLGPVGLQQHRRERRRQGE